MDGRIEAWRLWRVPSARPRVAERLLDAVDAREDVLAGDRELRGRLPKRTTGADTEMHYHIWAAALT